MLKNQRGKKRFYIAKKQIEKENSLKEIEHDISKLSKQIKKGDNK